MTNPLLAPGLPSFAPEAKPSFTGGNFPFTPVLDDFTRGSLGANWTTPWLGTAGTLSISANKLIGTAAAGAWNPQAFGPDCEVYVDLPGLPAVGNQIFLDLRRQSLNSVITDGYELRITPSTGEWRIRKLVQGASTVLTIIAPFPVAAGDSIGFRAVGNTLTAWHANVGTSDWVLVGSVDDPTFPDVIGYIGLQTNSGVGGTTWDNFGGGSLSPVVVSTPLPNSAIVSPFSPALGRFPSTAERFPFATQTALDELAVSITGPGSLAPRLSVQTALASGITGTSTLALRLNETTSLRTAIAGTGALSPKLSETVSLRTVIAGIGTLAPNLRITRGLAVAISGLGSLAAKLNETARLALAAIGIGSVAPTLDVQSSGGPAPANERTKTGSGT